MWYGVFKVYFWLGFFNNFGLLDGGFLSVLLDVSFVIFRLGSRRDFDRIRVIA